MCKHNLEWWDFLINRLLWLTVQASDWTRPSSPMQSLVSSTKGPLEDLGGDGGNGRAPEAELRLRLWLLLLLLLLFLFSSPSPLSIGAKGRVSNTEATSADGSNKRKERKKRKSTYEMTSENVEVSNVSLFFLSSSSLKSDCVEKKDFLYLQREKDDRDFHFLFG